MMWLRQSTATEVSLGPFLDETDGKTPETGLTITQPDIRLKKAGGAWAQKSAAQTLSHEENGWYEVALSTTDTNTLGSLLVAIHEAGALPVWREFTVVPAVVYDAMIEGSDNLNVDVVGHTPQTGDAFARLGAPAGASIAADIAVIEAQTDDIGVAGAGLTALATQASVNTIDTVVDAIKAKTDNLPSDPADQSLVIAAASAIEADTQDIQARLPAALVGGRMAANAEVVGDKTGYALTTAEHAAVADKLLGRSRAGGADGGRTVSECLAIGRNKWDVTDGVLTVYGDDDVTPLFSGPVTAAAGDPLTSFDPA